MNKRNKGRKSKVDISKFTFEEYFQKEITELLKINKTPCKIGKNKICLDNIYCINGLLQDNNSIDDISDEISISNSNENLPKGLHNFGNTCYLNSLLQIYFHILDFREIIFNCKNFDSDNILKVLQKFFSQMQLSFEKALHPVEIIAGLELSENVQQDAPEFHSLFMILLDSCKSNFDRSVGALFTGKQSFCTTCQHCGYSSTVESEFRELSLKPMTTLESSIQSFLQVEKLTGDNCYKCPQCKQLRDGQRNTILRELPPVLCIQYMRYTIDLQGIRHKCSTKVQFPELLSMKSFVTQNKGSKSTSNSEYVLKAVLLHVGEEPGSGHYQTILHNKTNEWILCDDANVSLFPDSMSIDRVLLKSSNLKKSNLTLSEESSKISKKRDLVNLTLTSNNAYMLFYEAEQVHAQYSDKLETIEVPENLREPIEQANLNAVSLKDTMKETKLSQNKCRSERHECLELCLEKLVCDKTVEDWNVDNLCLISLKTLKNGLGHFEMCPDPDSWPYQWMPYNQDSAEYSTMLCPHNKLAVKISSSNLRLVKKDGITSLREKRVATDNWVTWDFPEGLCSKCWRYQYEKKRAEAVIKKNPIFDQYKKLAESGRGDDMGQDNESFWASRYHMRQYKSIIGSSLRYLYGDESKEGVVCFNEDIVCEKHGLRLEGCPAILIDGESWRLLVDLIYGSLSLANHNGSSSSSTNEKREHKLVIEIKLDDVICSDSKCMDENKSLVDWNGRAESEKKTLSFLLNLKSNLKKRISYDKSQDVVTIHEKGDGDVEDEVVMFVLPMTFVVDWHKFVKNPDPSTVVMETDYSDLQCDHDQPGDDFLLFKPLWDLFNDDNLVLLWQHEMSSLQSLYSNLLFQPIEVVVSRSAFEKNWHLYHAHNTNTESPSDLVCVSCMEYYKSKSQSYTDSIIYIHIVDDLPTLEQSDDHNGERSSTPIKIQKKCAQPIKSNVSQQVDTTGGVLRRSERSKKHPNDTPVRVSSDTTLRNLKVKLMHQFEVTPLDQYLFLEGRSLEDNEMTMLDMGVQPGMVLQLFLSDRGSRTSATTSNGDGIHLSEQTNQTRETGFQGTKLCE